MSAIAVARRRSAFATRRVGGYAAAALVMGFVGWMIAAVPDSALVPATAGIATAVAIGLSIIAARRRTLTSPLFLLGVPLLLSLAAAMQPITRIFNEWTLPRLTEALLIVAAPLVGVAAAMLLTPGRTPQLERGTTAQPYPSRLVAACAFMFVVGTLIYVAEWSTVGGPPLLSASIDQARFGVEVGLQHVFTQGLPLALLIAMWARVGRPQSFTAQQRRVLEAIICLTPIVLALGGGRALVLVPLLAALLVAARYVSRQVARRMLVVIPIGILVFSSVVFVARIGQNAPTGPVGTVLYSDNGAKTSPWESAYRSMSIGLGQELRVVAELRNGDVRTPPFTTSVWFLHNFVPRAIDPGTITSANAGGWITATYAGPLLLDFGLIPALLFGLVLGAAAHAFYVRFAHGASVTTIWVYAYLAAPIAFAFYVNIFLQFLYPFLDLIVLITLSRLLIKPVEPRALRSSSS